MGSDVAEFNFSDLVREPTRIAAAVEARGRVILHRRDCADLALSRATEFEEWAGFTRLLRNAVAHLPSQEMGATVEGAFPWTRYLTPTGQSQFVGGLARVIQDCVELSTFAPLETYLAEWRDTAAIQADPGLADSLVKPIHNPLGQPVEAP